MSDETLEQRRDRLVAALANPDLDDAEARDIEAEATEVRTAIENRNRRAEMRAALLTTVPVKPAAEPQPETRAAAPTFTEVRERPEAPKSVGEMFTEGWATRGRNIGQQYGVEVRALIDNSGTSAGAFQNPARPAGVVQANADRTPRLADIINSGVTTSNSIEYYQEDTATGTAAAEVAEGALKPEATFTFSVQTSPVRTIAHWVPVTRQAMDDNPQMRSIIDGRLRYGLRYRLDQAIISGNGTSPNLRGILNTTGINTYAPAAAEARVISLRKAMTLVEQAEYAADTVVVNPADWEGVELSTDTQGMFRVSPNVANALAPRIWGMNVVSTTAIAAGTALVGNFQMGATLWDRQQEQVMVTDSHADFFIRNQLVVLAELRAALTVERPKCFTRVTFNGTA